MIKIIEALHMSEEKLLKLTNKQFLGHYFEHSLKVTLTVECKVLKKNNCLTFLLFDCRNYVPSYLKRKKKIIISHFKISLHHLYHFL